MAKPYIPYVGPVVTRAEARASGAKWFFTGIPCKWGHLLERSTINDRCRACSVRAALKWQKNNPDKHAAIQARFESKPRHWLRNLSDEAREVRRQKRREKYAINPKAEITSALEWKAKNRGIASANEAKRRASRSSATPTWADLGQIAKIYEKCFSISENTGIKHNVDHIIPIRGKIVCGLHVHWNLQIIPASENFRKGAKLLPEHRILSLCA